MTRVQELGRLCQYPGTTDRLTLQTWATSSGSKFAKAELEQAFSFACKHDVLLEAQQCEQRALSLCDRATDVFAYVSWMGASGARRGSSEHRARLRQLVEAVADEVMHAN